MLHLIAKLVIVASLVFLALGCDKPLVVGGGGMSSKSGGNDYLTVLGNPARVQKIDPMQCAARFEFSFDPQIDAQFSGSSAGNTPDKYYWNGEYRYFISGRPFSMELAIDGRKKTAMFGGKTFRLARGNHFRIHVRPGPTAEMEQLSIINNDFDVDDENQAESIFRNADH